MKIQQQYYKTQSENLNVVDVVFVALGGAILSSTILFIDPTTMHEIKVIRKLPRHIYLHRELSQNLSILNVKQQMFGFLKFLLSDITFLVMPCTRVIFFL